MEKKTILLIEDDSKTEASIREALGKGYKLEAVQGGEAAVAFLAKKNTDLIIIDFDLKGKDGLQVFRDLKTSVKVIMLSASGNIPLAVSAAKLGVAEFLRKPIDADQLKKAVEKNISQEEKKLRWIEGMEWLRGESPRLDKMWAEIQAALRENKDIILVGEQGIPKEKVAEFIHRNGAKSERRLIKIDVASFRKENLEAHFWAAVQEIASAPETASVQNEEDRCGTIYLENVENLDEHFKLTIFNFFKERKGKIDKNIRLILGVRDKNSIDRKEYSWVEIPKLCERKEDLPYLLKLYLKFYSDKHNQNIKLVSTEVLDFLAAYDYPGNYLELEKLLEEAVLAAAAGKLELENFPLDFRQLVQPALKKGLREGLTFAEAKRHFEKDLLHVLGEKTKGENSKLARFLDIPKTALAERLENLSD